MVKKWSFVSFILATVLLFCNNVKSTTNNTVDHEVRLLQDILSNHDPKARPVLDSSQKVEVSIYMNIYELKEIDTKNQFISVIGWIGVSWYDERLSWNSTEYGGLEMIAVFPNEIWIPTFVLGNSRSEFLYSQEWFSYYKVKIYSSGRMLYAPGGLFTANCHIDVKYFPFDDQICYFKFENWVYDGNAVNLTFTASAENIFLDYYDNQNGQWDIEGVKVVRRDVYFSSSPTPYPQVLFGIRVKRKSLFYVVNIVLSSFLFIALFLTAFKLHPECGERISMGITLLLAFTIFVLMVQSSIPETSQNVPLIIVYLFFTMFLTSLGIIESILVLYFHYHSGSTPPPKWLYQLATYQLPERSSKTETKVISLTSDEKADDNGMKPPLPKDQLNGTLFASHNESVAKSQEESNVQKWRFVAAFIDKVSFWSFLSMYIFIITVIILIVPFSRPSKDLNNTIEWAGF